MVVLTRGGAVGLWWAEVRDAATHPTACRAALHPKNFPAGLSVVPRPSNSCIH